MKKDIINQREIEKKFDQENNTKYSKISQELFIHTPQNSFVDQNITGKKYSYSSNVAKKLFTSWTFILSLVILLVIFTLLFVCGKGVAIPDSSQRPGTGPANPSFKYIFGLGIQGEDFWNECWIAARYTMYLTLAIVGLQILIGLVIGLIWGYSQKSDILFINITNIINLVPSLVFIMVFVFIMGVGFWPIVIAVTMQSWIGFASATRVQVMIVRGREYNVASRTLGTNSFKILIKNVLPKIAPVIVSIGAFAIPDAISIDTSLSYLHYGFVDGIDKTSLGYLIQYVLQSNQWIQYPNLICFPILIVLVTSFFFFLTCHKLADSLDPRSHNS